MFKIIKRHENILDKNGFKELAEMSGDYSISIYLPSNKDRWIDPIKDINRIKLGSIPSLVFQSLGPACCKQESIP